MDGYHHRVSGPDTQSPRVPNAGALVASCLAAAANGEPAGYFDLGVAFASGGNGAPHDLVEAHKWFNLASLAGHADAARSRADVAGSMNPRDIAEAQRRARDWLRMNSRAA